MRAKKHRDTSGTGECGRGMSRDRQGRRKKRSNTERKHEEGKLRLLTENTKMLLVQVLEL